MARMNTDELNCQIRRNCKTLPKSKTSPLMLLGMTLIALAVGIMAGCGKSQPTSEQPAAKPKAATIAIDAAAAGTVHGTVSFTGVAPKMKPLDMTADPGCPTGPQPSEVVVVKDGK